MKFNTTFSQNSVRMELMLNKELKMMFSAAEIMLMLATVLVPAPSCCCNGVQIMPSLNEVPNVSQIIFDIFS